MMRLRAAFAVAAVWCSPGLGAAGEVRTGTLIVHATGFTNDAGRVLVQLANSAADYDEDDQGFRTAAADIERGTATIVFTDIPYGDYAVKLFQDENDNQKLDMGLTAPKERYGFSNNATGMFGPPPWEKARFRMAQPELTIQIDSR